MKFNQFPHLTKPRIKKPSKKPPALCSKCSRLMSGEIAFKQQEVGDDPTCVSCQLGIVRKDKEYV